MKQIRKQIFETNSSSTHSVNFRKNSDKYDWTALDEYVNKDDNKLHIKFGEFGWGYDEYEDAYNKLSYVLTMIMETKQADYCHTGITSLDEYYNLDEFILVESIITEHVKDCTGIVIDSKVVFEPYDDPEIDIKNESHGVIEHDGYIDHQSCEYYECLDDFLNDWGVDIESFIFDENIQLIIDNDNH